MADWPLKHDGPCTCWFVRREEFGEAEQTEWCGLHAAQRDELQRLRAALTEAGEELRWFLHEANSRGNEGPPRVWRLVNTIEGLVPNVELTGGALAPSSDRRERG